MEMLYSSVESIFRVLRKLFRNGLIPNENIFVTMAAVAALSAKAEPACGVAKKKMDLTESLISV